MTRSRWTWSWFALAVFFIFASLVCFSEVFITGITHGAMIGTPSSLTTAGQREMAQLDHRNKIASDGVLGALLISAICLGTGLRVRYRWTLFESYFAAVVICPLTAVAICVAFLALHDLFHRI